MALIDTLIWRTSVDLKGLRTDLDAASRLIKQVEQGTATFKAPTLDFKRGGDDPTSDLASAFIPAANQIKNSLQGAFSGLEPTFRRLAVQIEALTGASIAHFRRLDSEEKFPKFMGGIAKLRGFIQGQFDSMGGAPLKFARVADKALGGIAFGAKLKNQIEGFRSFNGNAAREVARLRPPTINAAPAVAGVNAVKASADRATGSFKGLGLQIAGALGFVGVGYQAVGFLKEAIKNASDFNEVVNKSNVILGTGAGEVQRFAAGAAKDFGSSKTAVIEVATELAGLGKGLGKLEGDKLAKFSTDLTRLAMDVGSIDNKSLKEVGDAFRVGLSGEQSDVLKGLGIVLTETTVKAYALSHGIGKIGEELSEESKLMARAGLITDGLAFANGDLARTINDPANAYRKFTGQVENLGAALGTVLLPVVNEVLGGLNNLATGTDDALGRSQISFKAWAENSAFAVNTLKLYFENWGDSVQLATLSAQQGIENFAAKIENQFGKIGDEISKAFESPLQFLGNELNHFWLNFQNVYKNIKELTSNGLGGAFVDINEGWKELDELAKRRPERKPGGVDNRQQIQALADRIEGRRAAKPTIEMPAPVARPNATVNAVNIKAAEKAQNELESFVKSFKDKVRTPLEEYGEAMKKAKEAFDKNLITADQFQRADKLARREAGFGEMKFAGAASLSSNEGYSTLVSALTGRGNEFGNQIAERNLRINEDSNLQLKQLNKRLGASNDPVEFSLMRA